MVLIYSMSLFILQQRQCTNIIKKKKTLVIIHFKLDMAHSQYGYFLVQREQHICKSGDRKLWLYNKS